MDKNVIIYAKNDYDQQKFHITPLGGGWVLMNLSERGQIQILTSISNLHLVCPLLRRPYPLPAYLLAAASS
jgi:hypothetical protein